MHDELRARVLAANRAIVQAGLVTLTFGNASGIDRAAGLMAIKPSGVPYEQLDERSIVLVEVASGDVVDGALRPSSDAPTHLVLYRRFPELGGVVHTHSPYATAWAQAGRELPCLGTTHADHFRGTVPVTRELTPAEIDGRYEEATGEVIVEAIEGRSAAALEAVAGLALRTLSIAADVAELREALRERHFTRKHGPGRYYGQP